MEMQDFNTLFWMKEMALGCVGARGMVVRIGQSDDVPCLDGQSSSYSQ